MKDLMEERVFAGRSSSNYNANTCQNARRRHSEEQCVGALNAIGGKVVDPGALANAGTKVVGLLDMGGKALPVFVGAEKGF
jgi:hypothetical protein